MWDDRSEYSIDPVTGNNAFQGYRVYRSTDRGNTWGTVITDVNGDPTDFYKPLAIYDYDDNQSGPHVMTDPLIYYNLGSNSGVKYSYVDNNIINGYEYWYAVSAYDGVDDWAGAPVDPMENPKAKNAFYSDNDNKSHLYNILATIASVNFYTNIRKLKKDIFLNFKTARIGLTSEEKINSSL